MSQRETGTEARQAERGKPTLFTLIVGVVLALAAGAAILTYQGSMAPSDPSSQSVSGANSAGAGGAASREQPANPSNPAPAQPKP